MHKKKILTFFKKAALSLAASSASLICAAQTVRPFHPNDKVAFVGNSITEQGYYESYIWLYYMLHYPSRRITIYNVGIGGDAAKNILARLDDDVFSRKPTIICLDFGMNDSGYFEYLQGNPDSVGRAKVKASKSYFDQIEKRFRAFPAEKIMITTSLYDETVKNPKNYYPKKSVYIDSIAAFQQRAAIANRWGFVDFLHPMTAITLREQKKDSTFTLTGNDRIHPGNQGHFVMAYLFLKQQGMAGKPVADVLIDAARKKIERSENCQLTALTSSSDEVRFDYLANSLPFPQDTIPRLWDNPHRQTEALSVIPFNEEMNREMLTVKGLGAGDYTVSIDGHLIGKWSNSQLAEGINLALQTNTPQYEQAMSVLWLNEERMGLESKLRAYYWLQFDYFNDIGLKYADNERAMDSLNVTAPKNWFVGSKKDNYRAARYPAVRASWQKQMDLLVDEIYQVNQPRKHTIVVKRG